MAGYLPVVMFLGLIVAFAVVSLGMAAALRPSRPYWSKLESYECGAEPITARAGRRRPRRTPASKRR